MQFWRLKRVCQWRMTLESLHEFQPCPRGKHPMMSWLSLLSCHFGMRSQLQLVLAMGSALLQSLSSVGRQGGLRGQSSTGTIYAGIHTILTDFIYLCSPPGICFYKIWRRTKFKYEFGLFSETGNVLTLTCTSGFRWIPFSEVPVLATKFTFPIPSCKSW